MLINLAEDDILNHNLIIYEMNSSNIKKENLLHNLQFANRNSAEWTFEADCSQKSNEMYI